MSTLRVDEQPPLQQRADEAMRRAAALLGQPQTQTPDLREVVDRLSARAAELGIDSELVRDQLAARDRLHARYTQRFEALDGARSAADGLRELTAPEAILAQAPEALCAASGFDRALLSVLGEGRMRAQAAHFRGDSAGARAALQRLAERPILLQHPLVESELVRRRRATIVADATVQAGVDPGLQATMRWRSYAAAPLIIGPTLIGVVHADRGAGTELDVLDRDVLWEFTSALGQVYESAMLRRRLRRQREQLRDFLHWLGARSGELTDAPVRLSTFRRAPRAPLAEIEAAAPGGARDDRAVFDGLLTRRELEVMRLLAEGRSNRSIAEALVITPGTVKFHVNRILRKLHVTNRSQAVARYLRLLGVTGQ
jgi:LuxR family transcriptional regulator, regulator of acetate metabolism